MRSCVIVAIACLVLGIAPALRSQTAPAQRDLERENAQLRERIGNLEAMVKDLQEQNSRLRARLKAPMPTTRPFDFRFPKGAIPLPPAPALPVPKEPVVPMPPKAPDVPEPPKGERREFNGQPYYVIPLELRSENYR
jgi:hypothetical protein